MRKAKRGGTAVVAAGSAFLAGKQNGREFRQTGEEVDTNPHFVSTPLLDSEDREGGADPTPKKIPKQGKHRTSELASGVPRASLEGQANSRGAAQVSGSGNVVYLRRSQNIGDTGALMSPSRAGERASAETARWLQMGPAFRDSSLVLATSQDRGEQPDSQRKVIGEGVDREKLACAALDAGERATASVGAAVSAGKPSFCASRTDGCEELQPLRVGLTPSNHADTPVEASPPVRSNFVPPCADVGACNILDSVRLPQHSPVEELSFVDSPLSDKEPDLRRPGASCAEQPDDVGACTELTEPMKDGVISGNFHELPLVDGSAHQPPDRHVTESANAAQQARDGKNSQLSIGGLMFFGDAIRSVCMPLALSLDPFSRNATSDLLPVAHLENVERTVTMSSSTAVS